MNPKTRGVIIGVGAIFGAGLVHSLLPPWTIWLRVAVTGMTAGLIAALLLAFLPHPPKA